MFHFNFRTQMNTGYDILMATEDQKPILDITRNLAILIELQRILTSIYFNKYR